mmetsp:Transcript_24863/g.80418  ORF Transcript_24863/g.80418 Transcript_24863/m.80418 type:complete len:234 (+) Transcript_24863:1134-1835(+)
MERTPPRRRRRRDPVVQPRAPGWPHSPPRHPRLRTEVRRGPLPAVVVVVFRGKKLVGGELPPVSRRQRARRRDALPVPRLHHSLLHGSPPRHSHADARALRSPQRSAGPRHRREEEGPPLPQGSMQEAQPRPGRRRLGRRQVLEGRDEAPHLLRLRLPRPRIGAMAAPRGCGAPQELGPPWPRSRSLLSLLLWNNSSSLIKVCFPLSRGYVRASSCILPIDVVARPPYLGTVS